LRQADLARALLPLVVVACTASTGRLTRDVIVKLPRNDPAAAYVDELVARAHAKRLATREQWLRLGHWKSGWTGYLDTQADGENFFLSPRGETSPTSELDATLRAFFARVPDGAPDDQQHPICQFPARFAWLAKELAFDPTRMPQPPCERFHEFLKRVDAEKLSLVFSSYYLNNPASVFGHTFVRIIKRGTPDEERRELLDHAVEFSATVDTANPVIYGLKGIIGAFPGTFRNIPYHIKVRQYNDFEARDLYEYELALTDEEIQFFLAHLWELGSTFFDYFYVSENCSYHLLGALDAVRPSLDLVGNMHWPVIPADTVKALYANNLVKRVSFRPSLRRQFQARVAGLPDSDLALIEELVADPKRPITIPPARARVVLDAAQDLVDIRFARALHTEVDSAPARIKQTLLERRAELLGPSEPFSVRTPWGSMPQLGHDSRRIGAGYALDDAGTHIIELEARLALHDLADPTPGYPSTSQLEFLPTRLYIGAETGDVVVESSSLVRLVSLSPWTRFEHKLTWKADAGMVHLADVGCSDCYAARLAGGTGFAAGTSGDGLIAFGTIDAHVLSGPDLDGIGGIPLRAGLGPSLGLRLALTDSLVSLTTGELIWLPTQEPVALWRARTTLRLGLGSRFALDLEATVDGSFDTAVGRGHLLGLVYF
jgi:hypothetical protein